MANKRIVMICLMVMLASACVRPDIDTSSSTFNEQRYQADLNNCREGDAVTYALYATGGSLFGAIIGASNGAYYGAIAGDTAEGTVIGVVVGSVVGLGAGSVGAVVKRNKEVKSCLRGKGYVLKEG
jgi:hypothetical protein